MNSPTDPLGGQAQAAAQPPCATEGPYLPISRNDQESNDAHADLAVAGLDPATTGQTPVEAQRFDAGGGGPNFTDSLGGQARTDAHGYGAAEGPYVPDPASQVAVTKDSPPGPAPLNSRSGQMTDGAHTPLAVAGTTSPRPTIDRPTSRVGTSGAVIPISLGGQAQRAVQTSFAAEGPYVPDPATAFAVPKAQPPGPAPHYSRNGHHRPDAQDSRAVAGPASPRPTMLEPTSKAESSGAVIPISEPTKAAPAPMCGASARSHTPRPANTPPTPRPCAPAGVLFSEPTMAHPTPKAVASARSYLHQSPHTPRPATTGPPPKLSSPARVLFSEPTTTSPIPIARASARSYLHQSPHTPRPAPTGRSPAGVPNIHDDQNSTDSQMPSVVAEPTPQPAIALSTPMSRAPSWGPIHPRLRQRPETYRCPSALRRCRPYPSRQSHQFHKPSSNRPTPCRHPCEARRLGLPNNKRTRRRRTAP